jgi:hypothetical protein
MKQIALAITCGFALVLTTALVPIVIMQRQWNLVAPQNQQRLEAREQRIDEARRLEEQQQQRELEQQRLEASGGEARWLEQQQQWALEQQRLDQARQLEEQQQQRKLEQLLPVEPLGNPLLCEGDCMALKNFSF